MKNEYLNVNTLKHVHIKAITNGISRANFEDNSYKDCGTIYNGAK